MAGRLNPSALVFGLSLCVGAGGFAAGQAHAQLSDPTKPPAAIAAPAGPSAGTPAPVSAGLQSIIRRQGGKPAALINGEVVELGGMVGEAKLVKVGEDHVVLKGADGEETLRLIPAAEKQVKVGSGKTVPAAKAKDGKRGEGR